MGSEKDVPGMPGWVEGNAADLLGLGDEESRLIEFKVTVAMAVRRLRAKEGLTQGQLAKAMGTYQSQIAKIEGGLPGVSLDLIMGTFFVLGGNITDLSGPLMDARTASATVSQLAEAAPKGKESRKASIKSGGPGPSR